jgi:mannosyltransferase OCH1-like enzyme
MASITKIIPRQITIERRIKKMIHTPAVSIRQIERRITNIIAIMPKANAIEIIRQVNPAQPKARIANARAKIINPNRQSINAITIPVMLTSRINRERQSTVPAIHVIVRMRQITTSVKNGMAVAIIQHIDAKQNPNE